MIKHLFFIFFICLAGQCFAQDDGIYVPAGSYGTTTFYGAVDLSSAHYSTSRGEIVNGNATAPGYLTLGASFDGLVKSVGNFINASDANNVDGYVASYTNAGSTPASFTLAVGTGTALHSISYTSTKNDDFFGAAWIDGNPNGALDHTAPDGAYSSKGDVHSLTSLSPGILSVYGGGQWDWVDFSNSSAGMVVTVQLPDLTGFNPANKLRLVGWDGAQWIDLSGGTSNATGNTAGSTMTGTLSAGITALAIGATQFSLPVSITKFNVSESNCDALLSWETGNGDPIASFDIEQSSNGVNFTKIENVVANQNGNTVALYSYKAKQISRTSYYRLKVIAVNGNVTYTKVVALTTLCGLDEYMVLSPNPVVAVSEVKLRFKVSYQGNARVIVTNNLGQQLMSKPIVVLSGENILPINITRMAAGAYYLRVVDMNGRVIGNTQKLIKQN